MEKKICLLMFIIFILAGCGGGGGGDSTSETNPTTPTTTTTPTVTLYHAPTPNSPANGAELKLSRPTLTINDSTHESGVAVTYEFQVSDDPNFKTITASASGINEIAGSTSWRVTQDLSSGKTYYWRVKASFGSNGTIAAGTSDWMSASSFKILRNDREQLEFLFREFATEIMNLDISMKGWDHNCGGYFQEKTELEDDFKDYSKIVIKYRIDIITVSGDQGRIDTTATFTSTERDDGVTRTSSTGDWVLKYNRIGNEWKITDSRFFSFSQTRPQ